MKCGRHFAYFGAVVCDCNQLETSAILISLRCGTPVSDPARLENQQLHAGSETGAPVLQKSQIVSQDPFSGLTRFRF